MNKGKNANMVDNPQDISVNDVFNSLKNGIAYIKKKLLVILLFSVIGALIGLAYSFFKKPVYTAICTFVLEDGGKGGSLGQYAGLASLAGIDVSGGSDLFQGDNIIELYKSRLMIEKTLLSEVAFNGKNQLLIDRYVEFNKLREHWKKADNIDSISFYGDPDKFDRHQDSIITDVVEIFNSKFLTVFKPDKKLSIINVSFSSKDELFAMEFTNKLVETVNDFYVQTKTKKSYQNLTVLQHQADSVKQVLNSSITGVASAMEASPNANPLLVSLKVPSQKKQIDVQSNTAIYTEVVKNLEIAKISLRQEKPLIQIIDSPVLPLMVNKVNKVKGILIGFIIGGMITVVSLLLKRFIYSFSK